jgi:predicted kinase
MHPLAARVAAARRRENTMNRLLVAMAGLPGSGKSSLARRLSRELGGIVLDKDRLRAALFPAAYLEYTTRQDDFVVELLLQTAAYLFQHHSLPAVFLDGRPFSRAYQLERVRDFALAHQLELRVIYCTCAPEIARRRLDRAVRRGTHPAGNRDFALYQRMRAEFEPLQLPHLELDTGLSFEHCVQTGLAYLHN